MIFAGSAAFSTFSTATFFDRRRQNWRVFLDALGETPDALDERFSLRALLQIFVDEPARSLNFDIQNKEEIFHGVIDSTDLLR